MFNKLRGASIASQRFSLSAEDVAYMNSRGQSLAKLDFGSMNIQHLRRIHSFVSFRGSLPSSGVSPLKSLFIWADDVSKAAAEHLVNQDELIRRGVIDADSMFEFFLLDMPMTPLVEASRIRQAISTIHLFVQRCFLGLESEYMPIDILDRAQWEWMKNYSTWASNRKVFLYLENLIGPSLRVNKPPFFMELETELAQSELTKETVNSVMDEAGRRVEPRTGQSVLAKVRWPKRRSSLVWPYPKRPL